MAELKLSLSNPGMSDLHKVGLGGLYMTLKSLDLKKKKIPGLEYSFNKREVVLNFDDKKLGKALAELIKYSFKIDKTGFFHFPALELNGTQPIENKLISHDALIKSFFQHGSHRAKEDIQLNLSKETKRPYIIKKFPKLLSYISQNSINELFDEKKNLLKEKIEIIGWMYLGGSEKHAGLNNTKLTERLETAFPLLFASIGCIYLSVKIFNPHLKNKTKACIVIPTVNDLTLFALNRARIAQYRELEITVAGLAEASLFTSQKFYLNQNSHINKNLYTTVISFGDTKWNTQQKSKTSLRKYKINDERATHNYSIITKILKPRYKIVKETRNQKDNIKNLEYSYISIPISKELFCDNLTNGKPFYTDFYKLAVPNRDKSGKLKYRIKFEQKELNEMIEKINFDYEAEKIFIKACHTAWKHRLGKLGSDSKKPGASSFDKLVARDFERLRVALSKSKNFESFRETITDFWSRAGRIQELTDGWEKVMILLEPENWKRGRDLALLALVSYKPKNEKEETALKKLEFDDTKGEEDE
ncbi:type I-MYXAN CRISPR-associated Cas8a1/Cmx1 [Leptospira santarosai]|uniref:type I-MYXAN CRISPR-associated Cas8a1/Cmx1 n=1 Tax=Leptospira santarosai TaxID=28183 RepID=UPI000518F8BD|nr:type I-MYXAN CRISPR-associated Cas8a1/Cmx1 [Leptospira santarosai]MDI7218345.1 type I-MYXAN CRISPR-associated Cas8a1/Cmx1 [Leptospira santarosai]